MDKERNADALIAQINAQTENDIRLEKQRIEEAFQAEMKQYRDKVEEETDIFMRAELADLKLALIQSDSQAKWKLKRDLLEERSKLVTQLFENIYQQLQVFSATDAYQEYLRTKLQAASKLLNMGNGTLHIRKNDEAYITGILKTMPQDGLCVEVSDDIHLGGFHFISADKTLECDYTLEAQLHSQKDWFFEHSKLVV